MHLNAEHRYARLDRIHGALLGLAWGDAIGFPALFHRTFQFPERRRDFLWRTNAESARERITQLCLPFTHRIAAETLEPGPTNDTEYALLAARMLIDAQGTVDQQTFLQGWRSQIVSRAGTVLTGFSERSAVENLRRGIEPPASGNDNPQHYDDSACCRAVAIGLYCAGDPERAAQLAQWDAQITNAEDGIYSAQAVAVALSRLAAGGALADALSAARLQLPPGSWIDHNDGVAQGLLSESGSPADLLLLLQTDLINTVYSYGNAAPETVPAAFVIAAACRGDLQQAVLLANAIPKAADSLPALVGALCGARMGAAAVTISLGQRWVDQLEICRGICLPFLQGVRLDETANALAGVAARENPTTGGDPAP